ncbi:protein fantom isoform X1 [Microplitis demolitor]|uniref:protein fantom isoform X1 n=1 Tax=Microplitis demolitor TaxID=69319 RepID=UPI000440002F|nr:protein fantom isoform X1 [Microplitis demolitor]XP_053598462.1 protein fantom isoform X1 [Microplitis demolitor]
MADDPNRDYLPRDNSYLESYRSINALHIDPRERLVISKLNRDILEDKYLRLIEEYQELKKLCNSHEDKIKRLTTKLMRISASPSRPYTASTININNDKDRIASLTLEINKLKEKIHVYRTQLLSHGILRRSCSQIRRVPNCSSGTTTFRSEGRPIKLVQCQNFVGDREENVDNQNEIRIEELEVQKKTLINRIKELENKLSVAKNENQKDKVTENVEYIRVWRQMKLQQEKLVEYESKNKLLVDQVEELKSKICDAKKSCGRVTTTFVDKKLMSQLEEQITRSQNYQSALREKEEQIRDFTSEIKILQQHNNELIEISTKYSQVEVENIELKKQLADMMTDNHNLKCVCSHEQANIEALKAANAQLIDKLQEMQRSMDVLIIQSKSPKSHKEKIDKSYKCCEGCNCRNTGDRQSDVDSNKDKNDEYKSPRKPSIKNITYVECGSQTDLFDRSDFIQVKNFCREKNKCDNDGDDDVKKKNEKCGNLSAETMLKLLDDAQINTPLDAQNVAKIRSLEGLSPRHYGESGNRQRQVIALETLLFGDKDVY